MLTKQHKYWIFSVSLLILTILAKLFFLSGLVYGLDYGLFHPDGMLYSFKTLSFLGHSELSAGSEVAKFYLENAATKPHISPESLFYQNNSNWQIFQLRILYPLLSVPFVYLFGLWGMLVLPLLSFVILWFFASAKLAHRPLIGIIVLLVLSSSTTISRWMLSNISDPLLVGLITVYIWLLPRFNKSTNLSLIAFHGFFIITTGLTRFSLLLWFAVAMYFLINRKLGVALAISALAFVVFLPNLFVSFSGAILASHASSPWYFKILLFPLVLVKMHVVEFGQLFVLDRIFLIGFCCTIWVALRNFKDSKALLFILVLVSLITTAGLNGVLGVNFRYHLPALPFALSFLAQYQGRSLELRK